MNKKKKGGRLFTMVFLAVLTMLSCFPAMAETDNETVTVGDFSYERTTEVVGGRTVKAWSLVKYHGTDLEVKIPDAIDEQSLSEIDEVDSEELQNQLLNGNIVTRVEAGAFTGNIEVIELPGYLMGAKSDMFVDLDNLKSIKGAGKISSTGLHTDEVALYSGSTLFIFPKGFVGSYEVKDGTTRYSSSVFQGVTIDEMILKGSLISSEGDEYNKALFVDASFDQVVLESAEVDEKTFLGACINRISGENSIDGCLIKGNQLLYYGYQSSYDFIDIESISSLAFQTEGLYMSKIDAIPDSLKENIVFRFYNGAGVDYTQRYFIINSKTAFCYDYGLNNPELVGDIEEYDNKIEPDTAVYNKIRALLYAGVPNNGDGLFEEIFNMTYDEYSYGLAGDAAKNAVGSLVWEVVSGQKASVNDIYGANENGFTKQDVGRYIGALRSSYIEKAEEFDLAAFELGFHQPLFPAKAQRLVVINEIYRPDPEEPEDSVIEISKQDLTSQKELPGAHLVIKDKDGKIIKEWISTNVPEKIVNLPDGEYVLIETLAPNGYKIASEIIFTIIDGKSDTSPIIMFDELENPTTTKPPGGGYSGKKDDSEPESVPESQDSIEEETTEIATTEVPMEERVTPATGDMRGLIGLVLAILSISFIALLVYYKVSVHKE